MRSAEMKRALFESALWVLLVVVIASIVLALTASPAHSRGGGGGGGRSSSSSKSFGGSKPSSSSKSSSSPKYSNGTSKPSRPTMSKPSSGSIPQKAPVTRLIPPTPPKPSGSFLSGAPKTNAHVQSLRVPTGRSYSRDRTFLVSHPAYADPYGRSYYGSFDSPFFYMWMFSMMDNDRSNDPLPPESDTKVSDALPSYLGIIKQEVEMIAGAGR